MIISIKQTLGKILKMLLSSNKNHALNRAFFMPVKNKVYKSLFFIKYAIIVKGTGAN